MAEEEHPDVFARESMHTLTPLEIDFADVVYGEVGEDYNVVRRR